MFCQILHKIDVPILTTICQGPGKSPVFVCFYYVTSANREYVGPFKMEKSTGAELTLSLT